MTKARQQHEAKRRTCGLFVKAIPLHLAAAHIAADEILAIAQENTVANSVDVRRCEVADASVACVLAVVGLSGAHKLLPNLQTAIKLFDADGWSPSRVGGRMFGTRISTDTASQ